MKKIRCYIGLGSNLGNSVAQLQSALSMLQQHPAIDLQQASSLYRSKPYGPQDQPDYVNAVAAVDTALDAPDLLQQLLHIEAQHGRVRKPNERWGPRTLDLDLLLYGQQKINLPQLTVPHPQLHLRSFVVHPLYEIAPELALPDGQALVVYYQALPGDDLEVLPPLKSVH